MKVGTDGEGSAESSPTFGVFGVVLEVLGFDEQVEALLGVDEGV